MFLISEKSTLTYAASWHEKPTIEQVHPMALDNWAAMPQPWPPAQGVPFYWYLLLDLICLHRQCKAKGHLCVGCYKDAGDIIVVWSTVCGLIGDKRLNDF